MKSRSFLYVVGQAAGLLIGYMLSISGLPTFNVLFTIAVVLFVPLVIHLLGPRTHSSHIGRWERIRTTGPLRFVLIHYVLYLGVPSAVAVFFGIAIPIESPILHIRLMVFVALALLAGIAAIGYYEWVQCEKDFSTTKMENTAHQFHTPVEGEQTT
jgi:hypothetical protein